MISVHTTHKTATRRISNVWTIQPASVDNLIAAAGVAEQQGGDYSVFVGNAYVRKNHINNINNWRYDATARHEAEHVLDCLGHSAQATKYYRAPTHSKNYTIHCKNPTIYFTKTVK